MPIYARGAATLHALRLRIGDAFFGDWLFSSTRKC
jgi:hypothetical protein